MGFKIQVNGQVVHELDIDPRQVVGISVRTATGEASVAGFDLNDDFINLEIQYQLDNTLPIIEENARLAKADAVQNGEINEKLFPNENARRTEALDALAKSQTERSANSTEDLSQTFAEERAAVLTDQSITAESVQADAPVSSDTDEEDDLAFQNSQAENNAAQEQEIAELKAKIAEMEAAEAREENSAPVLPVGESVQ